MKKRILALLLCAVTLLSMTVLTGAAAESGSASADEPAPAAEPAPLEEPAAEAIPEQTEAPAPEAEDEPQPEDEPEAEAEEETEAGTDETPAGETSLFERILACTVLDDVWAIMDEAGEDALDALTDDQWAQIDAKIEALEPEPLPAVVLSADTEETAISETVYPTVSYTDVAPFGAPVVGE